MPWKASSVMEERLRFVARLLDGEAMTDVCRDFGISRKTGYKIFDPYREHGLAALSDRSRRPVRFANQLPQQVEGLIVRLTAGRVPTEVLEIVLPAGRVVALSQFPCRRPGEDGLDSFAGAAGGLGLLLPDRLERLDDEVDVDRRGRQPAEHRRCVGLKRVGPLLAMLGVAPAGPLSRDALGGALVEALGLGVPCHSGGPGNVARVDRVDPFLDCSR